MHVGWVMILDGPPPSYDELLSHVKARLPRVPRYRQKLLYPPAGIGRPFWIDDPRFNLEYHVRHSALPSPGSLEKLEALSGRLFSQRLDRSKPLWELWLVQGLAHGRFAILNKAHRAMVDGIIGMDLTTVLFDTKPEPSHSSHRPAPWIPHPEPTPVEVAVASVRDILGAPRTLLERLGQIVASPDTAMATLGQFAENAYDLAAAYIAPPTPTSFNVPIGPHRHIHWQRYRVADLKVIKDALGATLNDVYLACVAGALARWFRRCGLTTSELDLRAAVPVSLQRGHNPQPSEQRVVQVLAPLPVACNDPVERVRIVSTALQDLRRKRRALGARNIAAMQEFAPPALMAQVARLGASSRLFNLVVANVPGPQSPLYLMGREVQQIGPVGFLVDRSALMFLMVSYNHMLEVGLIADPDVVPELDVIGGYLDDAVIELRDATIGEPPPQKTARQKARRPAAKKGARR